MSGIVKLSRLAAICCLMMTGALFPSHPPCGSDSTPRAISEPSSPLLCNTCLDTATYAASLLIELRHIRLVNKSLMGRSSREESLLQRASLMIEEAA